MATVRTPSGSSTIYVQPGVSDVLVSRFTEAPPRVLKAFSYSAYGKPVDVFLPRDSDWLGTAMQGAGWSAGFVKSHTDRLATSAPGEAWAAQEGAVVVNTALVGSSQTAGHEAFHLVQARSCNCAQKPDGSVFPQWFFEGSAMFIGTQTSSSLGFESYDQVHRPRHVVEARRVLDTVKLVDIKGFASDPPFQRPYDIGMIGVEYLVASVGMEKFLDIFVQFQSTRDFATAFGRATGSSLTDFSNAFEASRASLLK